MRTPILLPLLLAPAQLGQTHPACDLVKRDGANTLLGGSANRLSMGGLGCDYSMRTFGLHPTVTATDWGASAKDVGDKSKATAARGNWVLGDEPGMGSYAYAEPIHRSPQRSAGKCGFVVVQGGKPLRIFVTDSVEKRDIAGKKEMLDKLRPLAQKAVQRI